MGDKKHRFPGSRPEFLQIKCHLVTGQRIERGKGLIHQKNWGIVDQAAAKRDALLHAARELNG